MMRRGQASRAALVAMILFFILILSALPASAQTATPPPAQAQSVPAGTAPVIDTAQLRLLPEYDDPGLLVILSGQFTDSTKLPLQVAFPVPAGARNIQATYQNETGSLINRDFTVKDGMLSYELPSKGFHLEYYVDRAPTGEQRDITYDFVAPYAVNALTVDVQQPARATGFTMTPASENSQTATDGLTYYGLNRRNLAAGEKLALGIKYSKADTGLSAPQLVAVAPTAAAAAQSTAGTTAAAAAATGSTNILPYLLIGLGLALLAGVLLYWVLTQRRTSPAATAAASVPATSRTRPAAQATASPAMRPAPRAQATGDAVSFCTNCGHPLKQEDRFCSQCGAQRRS